MLSATDSVFESMTTADIDTLLPGSTSAQSMYRPAAEAQYPDDENCSIYGRPWGMSESDDAYPATLFHCKSTISSGGPETIRGAIGTIKGVLCALEQVVGSLSYSAEGTDNVQGLSEADRTMSIDTTCFNEYQVADMNEGVIVLDSVIGSLLDADTYGFDHELVLSLTIAGQPRTYIMRFFVTSDKFGFAQVEEGLAPGTGGATNVTINLADGVVRYDYWDDRNGGSGADSNFRRHVRMRVAGDLDTTSYVFTSITDLQGIYASGNGDADQFDAATVRGNAIDGFRGYSYNYSDSTLTPYADSCLPADTCEGNTGFELTTDRLGFLNSRTGMADYVLNGFPVCDGNAGVLTFDVVPATGPLGVCE